MLQEILAQFNTTWTAVAAVVSMLCLVPTRAIKLLHLYDSHLGRRQYRILKELRDGESAQSPYAQYLDDALYLESFRIASGIRADRTKADFLIRLARTGHWNNWQIRQIARFLWVTPEQPRLTLRVTASETAGPISRVGSVFLNGHRMYFWTGNHVEGRHRWGFPSGCGRGGDVHISRCLNHVSLQ